MRLFRQQGYASTGLQQILAESGAPKGSLYHYFPGGKETLAEAAIQMAAGMIHNMLVDQAARHREPRTFLRGYCKVMAGWMEESNFRSGCPIATILLETVPASATVTKAGNRAIDSWIDIIAEVLRRDGTARRQAHRTAQLIVAAMEGALILSRVQQSSRPILDVATML